MVTVYERKRGLSRREVLRRGGALGASALLVISGSAVIDPEQAWGLETKSAEAGNDGNADPNGARHLPA